MFDQDKPEKICVDRELITSELHQPNDFYGQATILKEYTDYKRPLKLVFEHSLPLHKLTWDPDINAPFQVAFTASDYRKRVYLESRKFPWVINIGSGFLYAIEVFKKRFGQESNPMKRRGTVVFPSHSTHHIEVEFDYEEYAQKLINLPDEYQPVYVCLYWKDYIDGKGEAYEKHGIPVVSAGHIFDSQFMLRFYDICRNFKYATASSIGSHVFYSTFSGCAFFYTEGPKEIYLNPKGFKLAIGDPNWEVATKDFKMAFSEPSESLTTPQLAFLKKYVTTKIKSSQELFAILLLADIIHYAQKRWERIKAKGKRVLRRTYYFVFASIKKSV